MIFKLVRFVLCSIPFLFIVITHSFAEEPTAVEINDSEIKDEQTSNEPSNDQLMQLETAAIDGDSSAQTQLASMYYLGEGVEQNHAQAFAWYQLAAEQGDMNAQYSLGNMYSLGEAVQGNKQEAQYWYQLAASQGHSASEKRLDELNLVDKPNVTDENHYAGSLLPEDEVITLTETTEIRVADNTTPDGKIELESEPGLFDQLFGSTEETPATQTEPTDTVEVVDKSVESDNKVTTSRNDTIETVSTDKQSTENSAINTTLQPGPIVKTEIEEAPTFEEITPDNPELFALYNNAQEGDAIAQYNIGNVFYQGDNVTQNHEHAILWYRRSAQQGNANAQYRLGNIYLMGEGVEQNDQVAMGWYEQAAAQGHESAQHNFDNLQPLTNRTEKSEPVVINTEQDDKHTQDTRVTKVTSSESDYQQGMKFSLGDGVERDYKKAFQYFKQSADSGHLSAQYQLGIAYAFGEGVEKDRTEAAKWFGKAAESGDALAQRQLANMYWSGTGVSQDKAKAAAWFSIIADNGNDMDKQRFDSIRNELSVEELDKSRQIAAKLNAQLPQL